ncbi:MarR family winged helix-turn-helix transcriptional regulator [Nocardia blacklockiae]|uniref:MarR family winged helix-turn-helix transcriptional regulator n=1 Tax=Nocardia blacklockiae TaxID=480036 RepID=UPI0018930153|nr:MarR family transcriptional regulator [Nocardia blacklockiae]MBF6173647.1 MarR family transcriptional regulator [Nocardia blacklockiae]
MDKPTDLVEFETMLLGRYTLNPRYRRDSTHLDRSAYLLLSRLSIDGPMSIGQLSDAFRLDASTLNRQTAALVRSGLVERIPDPQGGMARKFRVTDSGESKLAAERRANVEGLGRVLADWSADDVAAFAAYLQRFNTDIERLDGRPWPRPES